VCGVLLMDDPITHHDLTAKIADRLHQATAALRAGNALAYIVMNGCLEDMEAIGRHQEVPCRFGSCNDPTHMVCAQDRQYSWANCPDVESILRRYAEPKVLRPRAADQERPLGEGENVQ
jgi:hypothetical protein